MPGDLVATPAQQFEVVKVLILSYDAQYRGYADLVVKNDGVEEMRLNQLPLVAKQFGHAGKRMMRCGRQVITSA